MCPYVYYPFQNNKIKILNSCKLFETVHSFDYSVKINVLYVKSTLVI